MDGPPPTGSFMKMYLFHDEISRPAESLDSLSTSVGGLSQNWFLFISYDFTSVQFYLVKFFVVVIVLYVLGKILNLNFSLIMKTAWT